MEALVKVSVRVYIAQTVLDKLQTEIGFEPYCLKQMKEVTILAFKALSILSISKYLLCTNRM